MARKHSLNAVVENIDNVLFRAAQAIACLSLFAMIVVTFVDVAGRHFATALPGAAEYISTLLGTTFFAGMAMVVRSDGHIVVGLAVSSYGRKFGLVEKLFTTFVSFLSMVLIAWLMFDKADDLRESQMLTKFLGVELWYSVYAMALLALIATIIGFFRLVKVNDKKEQPEPITRRTSNGE